MKNLGMRKSGHEIYSEANKNGTFKHFRIQG